LDALGRATHIHLLAHHMQSTSLYDNKTLEDSDHSKHGAQASHVGQLFFDTSLIPYMGKSFLKRF